MRTKYFIKIGGVSTEIPDGCLKNWDEIQCAYKRTDLCGVTRSFTTKFEFVGDMYDRLLALYLAEGVDAKASLSFRTIKDDWSWEERFSCDLDFSSISWDNYVLSINCIDNSLASCIKSNKGTKFEFTIGSDIIPDDNILFDRVQMQESVTYEFTQGERVEDSSATDVTFKGAELPYIGNVGSEISVGGAINWAEDQADGEENDYILIAEKDISVSFDWEICNDNTIGYFGEGLWESYGVGLELVVKRADEVVKELSGNFANIYMRRKNFIGEFDSSNQLPSPSTLSNGYTAWAVVGGIIWEVDMKGSGGWQNTYKTKEQYVTSSCEGTKTLTLKKGDKVYIQVAGAVSVITMRILKSSFEFSWKSRGNAESINVFRPITILSALMSKIYNGSVELSISDYDTRMANTFLIAAESARGLSNAKLYASFNEFCDWMSTVFGYAYKIEYRKLNLSTQYVHRKDFYAIVDLPEDTTFVESSAPAVNPIAYDRINSRFYTINDDGICDKWLGSEDYNDASKHSRTDTVFHETLRNVSWVFELSGSDYALAQYASLSDVKLSFLHRSELFSGTSYRRISESTDVQYSVDAGYIYSAVLIGYDKKDYNGINGRDEFNFNNTYSTGCTVSDKTLQMISKFRADSYGLEFAVQSRGKDSTDNASDKDVFFILAKKSGGMLVPDRTAIIGGSLSDTLFNGAFSPMECVSANAGYISMQNNMSLQFASSTGNSDIVVGGKKMSADINLSAPLVTCGRLSFASSEFDDPFDPDSLIEVCSDGVTYKGFVEDATFKYARNAAIKYKLIVKEVAL